MSTQLIGLSAAARHGKSTVANYLCNCHDYHEFSFAQPIRAAVASILGIKLPDLDLIKETPIKTLGGITPRQMMQTMGTEWGRNMVHQELWIKTLANNIKPYLDDGKRVVVSDVRYGNEAKLIQSLDGQLVRIHRPEGDTTSHSGHSSEQPEQALLDRVTYDLLNTGHVQHLYGAVDDMLRDFYAATNAKAA